MDYHLGLAAMPSSFVELPAGFLRGFRLDAAASVTLPEMRRSRRCLGVFSSNGLFKMNKKARPVITSTCKDFDNQISDMMLTLVVSESEVDCDFHHCSAIVLAYGAELGRVVLLRVDQGWALQAVCLRFVLRFCNEGMYRVPSRCRALRLDDYYHSVNQKMLTDYSCKSPEEDGGAGTVVKDWLSQIFRLGTPADATGATRELTDWLRDPEQKHSPHHGSLTKVTMDIIGRSSQLGMAAVHPDAQTRMNMAGWSESTHNVHKSFAGKRRAATLEKMGEGFVAVARGRENKKVSVPRTRVLDRSQPATAQRVRGQHNCWAHRLAATVSRGRSARPSRVTVTSSGGDTGLWSLRVVVTQSCGHSESWPL